MGRLRVALPTRAALLSSTSAHLESRTGYAVPRPIPTGFACLLSTAEPAVRGLLKSNTVQPVLPTCRPPENTIRSQNSNRMQKMLKKRDKFQGNVRRARIDGVKRPTGGPSVGRPAGGTYAAARTCALEVASLWTWKGFRSLAHAWRQIRGRSGRDPKRPLHNSFMCSVPHICCSDVGNRAGFHRGRQEWQRKHNSNSCQYPQPVPNLRCHSVPAVTPHTYFGLARSEKSFAQLTTRQELAKERHADDHNTIDFSEVCLICQRDDAPRPSSCGMPVPYRDFTLLFTLLTVLPSLLPIVAVDHVPLVV
jgi:hypothetical protein